MKSVDRIFQLDVRRILEWAYGGFNEYIGYYLLYKQTVDIYGKWIFQR